MPEAEPAIVVIGRIVAARAELAALLPVARPEAGMAAAGLIVAAPRSGAGKTTVTLGLLAALRRAGRAVRAAKVRARLHRPGFHAAATGRRASTSTVGRWRRRCSTRCAQAADRRAAGDEAAMGLFDGVPAPPGRSGAAADLAARFGLPVLLVLDISGQAQSAAAVARGFAAHREGVRVAGVVLNRVAANAIVPSSPTPSQPPAAGARRAAPRRRDRTAGAASRAGAGGGASRARPMLDRLADAAVRHLDLDAIRRMAAPPAFVCPAEAGRSTTAAGRQAGWSAFPTA